MADRYSRITAYENIPNTKLLTVHKDCGHTRILNWVSEGPACRGWRELCDTCTAESNALERIQADFAVQRLRLERADLFGALALAERDLDCGREAKQPFAKILRLRGWVKTLTADLAAFDAANPGYRPAHE